MYMFHWYVQVSISLYTYNVDSPTPSFFINDPQGFNKLTPFPTCLGHKKPLRYCYLISNFYLAQLPNFMEI